MMKPSTPHNAIGTNAGCNGVQTGGQNSRKANALKLFGKRSTATRTRPSRCRDNDGPNAALLQLDGNLCTNSAHCIQAAQIANCDIERIEEFADLP